eukprot:SAG25_NODE_204_length_11947_cov_29.018822_14_plen_75_part_01
MISALCLKMTAIWTLLCWEAGGGRSKLVKHGRECPFIDTVNRKVLVRRCLAGPALLAEPVLSAAQLAPHPASPPA